MYASIMEDEIYSNRKESYPEHTVEMKYEFKITKLNICLVPFKVIKEVSSLQYKNVPQHRIK